MNCGAQPDWLQMQQQGREESSYEQVVCILKTNELQVIPQNIDPAAGFSDASSSSSGGAVRSRMHRRGSGTSGPILRRSVKLMWPADSTQNRRTIEPITVPLKDVLRVDDEHGVVAVEANSAGTLDFQCDSENGRDILLAFLRSSKACRCSSPPPPESVCSDIDDDLDADLLINNKMNHHLDSETFWEKWDRKMNRVWECFTEQVCGCDNSFGLEIQEKLVIQPKKQPAPKKLYDFSMLEDVDDEPIKFCKMPSGLSLEESSCSSLRTITTLGDFDTQL